MPRPSPNRNRDGGRPPLDAAALERLALHYLGRYATTRARLSDYLRRKLDERGWAGEGAPPIDAIVARAADMGYVDDLAFAEMRRSALARRGYGARRQAVALRAAGVVAEDAATVLDAGQEAEPDGALRSALAFARRRRIGPFAAERGDPDARRRALAAMLRAGHAFDVARRLVDAAPGEVPED